jgi:hypothetical protein
LSWRAPAAGAVLAVLCSLTGAGPAAAIALFGDDAGLLQAGNLFEYQAGRDPTVDAEDLTEWIDQFILDYTRGELRLGLRVERYQSSLDKPPVANYDELTQKYAEWSTPDLRVRFGLRAARRDP